MFRDLYRMLFNSALKVRALIVKFFVLKTNYFLFSSQGRPLKPISTKYGFDRGIPVDRYYIEKFVSENSSYIKGHCMEIHDTYYAKKYGKDSVTKADALDVEKGNIEATIVADLRNMPQVSDNTYDCIVLTHTLGVIDDYESAIRECYRVLKPGGSILITVSAIGIAWDLKYSFWRFTVASMSYVFGKYFGANNVKACSYGNVLTGQAFWVGLASDELAKDELDYNDPHFPVIVGVVATK